MQLKLGVKILNVNRETSIVNIVKRECCVPNCAMEPDKVHNSRLTFSSAFK